MSTLQLQQVNIDYDNKTVVHDINLQVSDGEIACLLGPSGCGKTTLLRSIAGFETLKQGQITLGGTVISAANTHTPPEKRNIGMVFQDYALFPHLSIARNISFGIRHLSKNAQQARIDTLLKLVKLDDYGQRYPHELSGGQQQRIALARALAPKPKLLLLDEPFGSQDQELREILAREVRGILKQEKTTAILVTHDQHEAFAMADQIGVMQNGRLQQWDTAYNLYHEPANHFVARFIGHGTMLDGWVQGQHLVTTMLGAVQGDLPNNTNQGDKVSVLVRPDDIHIVTDAPRKATIIERHFRGAEYLYTLTLEDGSQFMSLAPSHQRYDVGALVSFELDMKHMVILGDAERATPA